MVSNWDRRPAPLWSISPWAGAARRISRAWESSAFSGRNDDAGSLRPMAVVRLKRVGGITHDCPQALQALDHQFLVTVFERHKLDVHAFITLIEPDVAGAIRPSQRLIDELTAR